MKRERKDHLEYQLDGKMQNNTNEVEYGNLMAENITQFSMKIKFKRAHKPII